MTFPSEIKLKAIEIGYTTIAQELEVSSNTVGNWFNGKTEISAANFFRLCDFLGFRTDIIDIEKEFLSLLKEKQIFLEANLFHYQANLSKEAIIENIYTTFFNTLSLLEANNNLSKNPSEKVDQEIKRLRSLYPTQC